MAVVGSAGLQEGAAELQTAAMHRLDVVVVTIEVCMMLVVMNIIF